jgi:hypothetical protein
MQEFSSDRINYSVTPVRAGLPKLSFIVDDICKPAPTVFFLCHLRTTISVG